MARSKNSCAEIHGFKRQALLNRECLSFIYYLLSFQEWGITTGGCRGTNSFTLSVEVCSGVVFSILLLVVEQAPDNPDNSTMAAAGIK